MTEDDSNLLLERQAILTDCVRLNEVIKEALERAEEITDLLSQRLAA